MRRRRCRTTEDISFSLSICQTSTQQATDVIITLNQEGSKNLSFCPQCHTHQGNLSFQITLSSKVWDWRLPSVDLIAFLLQVDWLIDQAIVVLCIRKWKLPRRMEQLWATKAIANCKGVLQWLPHKESTLLPQGGGDFVAQGGSG